MNIEEASRILHMNPQSLRIRLQNNSLPTIGIAYRNNANTGWKYLLNENEILKYKRLGE